MSQVSWAAAAAIGLGLTALMPSGVAVATGPSDDRDRVRIVMTDDCEPASFNAALGEGACVGNGTTTLNQLIGQLTRTGDAPAWAFHPGRARAELGDRLRVVNRGGEPHTFTKVAQFGGGCVEELNHILGLTPVPECRQSVTRNGKRISTFEATFVAAGQARTFKPARAGVHRYECLIHPWMRSVVVVRDDGPDRVSGV